MKISDLVKSLEKIKAKHGDLPIAFEVSDDDCCPIDKIHVTKIYDDDSTISEAFLMQSIRTKAYEGNVL